MILDTLDNAALYEKLHPGFPAAFAYLQSGAFSGLKPARYELNGAGMYVLISDNQGAGMAQARLEAHRAHIDIQYVAAGKEVIGWNALAACASPAGPFDADKDIGFYADKPGTWLTLEPGSFCVFFPADAHAPLAGTGPARKVVIKIRL